MLLEMLVHALDRSGNRIRAAAGECIAGVRRKRPHLARGHMQASRAGLQRAQHDAVARQNQAAKKLAVSVDGLDGHRRAHHHQHQRTRRSLRQQAMARTDHRHPAIRTEARRMVVSIDQTGLLVGRHDPLRRHVPDLHLLGHTALGRIARDHATQHALGRRQRRPRPFGQAVYVIQKFGTMRQKIGTRLGSIEQRPFETGVAHIDGQKCHASDYREFSRFNT